MLQMKTFRIRDATDRKLKLIPMSAVEMCLVYWLVGKETIHTASYLTTLTVNGIMLTINVVHLHRHHDDLKVCDLQ